METLPTTILEFEKRFREEEDCVVYLRRVRWPNGFICPKCGHVECYELNLRLYQCALCKKQTSVTAGTIFHKTHLPLTIWFRVIFSVAQDKGGASSSRIASQFSCSGSATALWAVTKRRKNNKGALTGAFIYFSFLSG